MAVFLPRIRAHGTANVLWPRRSGRNMTCSRARLLLASADGHDVEFVRVFSGKCGVLLLHMLEELLAVGLLHKTLSHPVLAQLLEPPLCLKHGAAEKARTLSHGHMKQTKQAATCAATVSSAGVRSEPRAAPKRKRHASALAHGHQARVSCPCARRASSEHDGGARQARAPTRARPGCAPRP